MTPATYVLAAWLATCGAATSTEAPAELDDAGALGAQGAQLPDAVLPSPDGLRCATEGVCTTTDVPGLLTGACRAADAEVSFDVRAHARALQPQEVTSLRWADWCGRLVDQHGATLVAVYGDEDCLDTWHPGWREGAALDAPVAAQRGNIINNPLVLDCLGKLMDDAVARQAAPAWVVLHALAHAVVLAGLGG